jgi:hypothetical protein
MASVTIPPVNAEQYAFNETYSYDAVATGDRDAIYLAALNGPLTIGAVGPASLVASIKGTASKPSEVEAGTAIWVDITGLTAIADTPKQVSVPGPYTAIRANVGTGQTGTLKVSVRMATYSTYLN